MDRNLVLVSTFVIACSRQVSAEDDNCELYCHKDCSPYYNQGGSEFRDCATANVNCNCGLPWFGILILAIASLFIVFFCCICLFRFIKQQSGGYGGGYYSTPIATTTASMYNYNTSTNGHVPIMNYPSPATNFPVQPYPAAFGNTNLGSDAQSAYNPSYYYSDPSAPTATSHIPGSVCHDAPPSYEVATKT